MKKLFAKFAFWASRCARITTISWRTSFVSSMGESQNSVGFKVCFIGGARYSKPLDQTSAKKFRLLKQLAGIFVIGFSQNQKPRRFSEHAHFYLLPKFPLPLLRYLAMFAVGPVLAFWLVWRHSVRILVAQSPYEGFAAAIAKVVAGWFGQRVALIAENHGDFEVSLFLQRRVALPNLYRWLMRTTARFALHHADLLRAVSNSTREQLQRWAPGKPLLQFRTWTDIDVFLKAGADRAREGQDIVYVGVLIPRKGVHNIINAFAKVAVDFPQTRLELIGREENEAYTEELKTQVERLGLNGRVRFVGEIPQAELAQWLRKANVIVLPTYSEGLPRVVFEAMAVGLPVIASAVSGIPEVVEEAATGFLVPPGDEVVLAERLRWVLEHPEEAEGLGQRARAFTKKFFSTEAYVNSYRQLFKRAQAILEKQ
jgi:glycosyltransferase involved in cell wall biosynthesis